MRTLLRAIVALTGLAMGAFAPAQQSAPGYGEIEVMPDHIVRRILADEPEQVIDQLRSQGRIKQGVIVGTKRWNAGVPITVCFFGGSRQIRQRIVSVASAWERQGAPVAFDFGDRANPTICRANRPADIRIGYSQPGYWSMIGQDSLVHVGQYEQSMNFARFDYAAPAEPEFSRVVLHEFGHALGFQHEHQQAGVGCESQFNWPVIYSYLQGPPNNWSIETIDFNMRSRAYTAGDVAGPFNRRSIMLYSFPANFYKDGERSSCFSTGNVALSPGDADLLRLAYGQQAPSRQTSVAALVAAAGPLTPLAQATLNERVRLFSADNPTKAQILRIGNQKYTDVDIKACSTGAATLALVEKVTQTLNGEPRLGLLRYRGVTPRGGLSTPVTILADLEHPEATDARRLEASLSQQFPGRVKLAENPGSDRWLLTVVICED